MNEKAIGVYATASGGWAAYDREGRTWRVSEAEAEAIRARAPEKPAGRRRGKR